ncbi:MAG: hypothetical protein HKN63_04450 [Rhodobacteraceae bacterium]|nr:hypothetical protein [Paracoccaceae bacterium]
MGRLRSTLLQAVDLVSTRIGTAFALAALCMSCAGAAYYLKVTSDRLHERQDLLQQRQVRNGFVAISDVERVSNVLIQALREGAMSSENEIRLHRLSDYLHVRA